MGIDPLLRAFWLAPFGGERRLLAAAEERVGVPAASLRVYSGADDLSIGAHPVVDAAALSFLLVADAPPRRRTLDAVVARLGPGATLVLLDHNAPRTVVSSALAAAHLALVRPILGEPAARRLRRPAARELQALGLEVERLRLLAGELFQAVLARKPR